MSTTNPPLHIAVQNGNIDIVKTLLEAGQNPDEANAEGLTPLHIAVQMEHAEIVALLAEAIKKKNSTPPVVAAAPNANTPLEEERDFEDEDYYCPYCGESYEDCKCDEYCDEKEYQNFKRQQTNGVEPRKEYIEKKSDETLSEYREYSGKTLDFWGKANRYTFCIVFTMIGVWVVWAAPLPSGTLPPVWLFWLCVALSVPFIYCRVRLYTATCHYKTVHELPISSKMSPCIYTTIVKLFEKLSAGMGNVVMFIGILIIIAIFFLVFFSYYPGLTPRGLDEWLAIRGGNNTERTSTPDAPAAVQSQPELPLTVRFRESALGAGMVIIITNNSKRTLTVEFQTTHAETNRTILVNFELPAGQTKEYGWMELGYQIVPGGTFNLSHPDYQTQQYRVPAPTR